jgi:hypothetical protein
MRDLVAEAARPHPRTLLVSLATTENDRVATARQFAQLVNRELLQEIEPGQFTIATRPTAPSSGTEFERWASGIDQPHPAHPGGTDTSNASSARSAENAWITSWSWARRIFAGFSALTPTITIAPVPILPASAKIFSIEGKRRAGTAGAGCRRDPGRWRDGRRRSATGRGCRRGCGACGR